MFLCVKYLLCLFLAQLLFTPKEDHLLTVIVPCFNCRESWLWETIDSLRAQTFKSFKLIIVDDGSHPAVQLNAKMTMDFDVSLVRHRFNKGLPAARNTGVKHAKSKFIIFLDPDDLIEPSCLEKLLLAYWLWSKEDESLGFVYPGTMQFRTGPEGQKFPYYYHAIPFTKRELLSLDRGFIPSFALIPRELYMQAGGMCTEVRGYEDYDFWLRLFALRYHGKVLGERLFWYRRHDRGRTMEIEARELEWRDELRMNNPRLFSKFIKERDEDKLFRNGPCYPRNNPTFSKVQFSLKELGKGRRMGRFVYMMIPWMERGGAEQYELDVLLKCYSSGDKVVIITDTKSSHPWRAKYEAIKNVEIFHLEEFNSNAHLAVDYLFAIRPPKLVILRNSWLGYEVSETYGKVVSFIDIHHLRNERWEQLSTQYEEYFHKHILITPELLQGSNKTALAGPIVDDAVWRYGYPKKYSGTFRVAFIGRIEEQKDPLEWSNIVSHLHPALWKRIVIGEGSLKRNMQYDESYEWIDDPGVLKRILVQAPTILLVTSKYEGVPITVLQCLTAGVPVLAPDDLFTHLVDPLLVRYTRNSDPKEIVKIMGSSVRLYFEHPQGTLYYDDEKDLCSSFHN